MLWSILALFVLLGTSLLILSNLRMVVRDIFDVIVASMQDLRFSNHWASNIAFLALWLLIFVLSFG